MRFGLSTDMGEPGSPELAGGKPVPAAGVGGAHASTPGIAGPAGASSGAAEEKSRPNHCSSLWNAPGRPGFGSAAAPAGCRYPVVKVRVIVGQAHQAHCLFLPLLTLE